MTPRRQQTGTSQNSAGDATVTAEELARRVGRSRGWVGDQVRKGLIPHARIGAPPLPGRKDTRPIMFTEEQAREIQARVLYIEYVPATSGVA